MEQDMLADMAYQFSDLGVKGVTCQKDLLDPFQVKTVLRLSSESLQYLYTQEELINLTRLLSNIVDSNY